MARCRQVLLVRHGEGLHNTCKSYSGVDPELTERGLGQAQRLRSRVALQDCELLVVSPLSRAVQTAKEVFGERPNCSTVLTSLHSERWGSRGCDEGRPKSQLVASYPFVASWEGFDELAEHWTPTRSNDSRWREERVPAFRAWLAAQPEQRIVVIGHGAFFSALLGRHLGNCEIAALEEREESEARSDALKMSQAVVDEQKSNRNGGPNGKIVQAVRVEASGALLQAIAPCEVFIGRQGL
eukprot:TRINITY_DN57985_c0_g1_i1.p1 TRINITY_DN57985_c0_g1~~TRINITY_DN57985_c0_g1_i1.p1  ORF type:complete len:249 (+),score=51.00 TRINITY_DN57985_c0_g1_i1:29-748(+)